ncbi:hypothetical protein Q9S36_33420 [Microbacterium sp. ARD31]|uniref:hypothetical protein n=1 Tax=Microbacterium sp. ARD31 TaxID=2962576 RepID=UPI002880D755|nr:hypothetical protein [Microbacterium sp. ARD31]MDT0185093.1 hypothetical protein [Microbacterium sp. ARD31]
MDVLNVVTAVMAVVAVVAAIVVAWVVTASASPEADALETLARSEAVLANEARAVSAAIDRTEEDRGEALVLVDRLQQPLAALEGMSDLEALASLESARSNYEAALGALRIPEKPEAYTPPTVDEQSLASIGTAIDDVTSRTTALTNLADEVRDRSGEMRSLGRGFSEAMAAFADTLPAFAETIIEENPDAEESRRDAVRTAAAAVAAVDLTAPRSPGVLTAYAESVTALREDQTRAEIEIAQRLAWEEELRRQQEQQFGGGQPAPGAPVDPTEPTDPPGPTNPEEPVDPTDPTDPTDPSDPVIPVDPLPEP